MTNEEQFLETICICKRLVPADKNHFLNCPIFKYKELFSQQLEELGRDVRALAEFGDVVEGYTKVIVLRKALELINNRRGIDKK